MALKSEHIKNNFKESGIKSIAILSSGMLIAQMITMFFQPLIARIYTPFQFGVLTNITSTVAIFSPILTLQYHKAIVTAKTDKEANIVSALTFYIILVVTFIVGVIIFFYRMINPTAFSNIGNWIYVLLPFVAITGFGSVLDSYNIRFGQFKLISSIALIKSITSNGFKLSLGLLQLGISGLIFSHFFSLIVGLIRQGKYVVSKVSEIFGSSLEEIIVVAKMHKIQPLFSMPGIFVTTFSYSILPIMLTSLYSIVETGYFSQSILLLGMPLTLISNNVSKVFFKNASNEKNRRGNFYESFKSTSLLLIVIAMIGFPIIWLFAEPVFALLYGPEWIKSGTFVKLLIPMYATRFIVTSLMDGFIISGKQFFKLVLQSLFIVEAVIAYWIAKTYAFPVEYFLTCINYSYLFNYCILFIVLYFTSKESRGENNERN